MEQAISSELRCCRFFVRNIIKDASSYANIALKENDSDDSKRNWLLPSRDDSKEDLEADSGNSACENNLFK